MKNGIACNGTNGHALEPVPNLRAPDPEPYHNRDPRADEELLVIQRILIQLARLPGPADVRRVLDYVERRLREDLAA